MRPRLAMSLSSRPTTLDVGQLRLDLRKPFSYGGQRRQIAQRLVDLFRLEIS